MQTTFLAFIGKPLAGKDTQADAFVTAYTDSSKISPGSILRDVEKVREHHPLWPLLGPHISDMEQGITLPDPPVIEGMMQQAKAHLAEGKKFLVFAGFPRTIEQFEALEDMAKNVEAKIYYIYLTASDEITYERSQKRNEGRVDDTPEVHAVRLQEFCMHVSPLVYRLRSEGKLIEIDGEAPIAEVTQAIKRELPFFHEPEMAMPPLSRR